MTIYSHSRLSTYEQCPYKFKLKYIDKIIPEVEQTIEAHLGGVVHLSLEWLYNRVKESQPPSIEALIEYYTQVWQENYVEGTLIANSNYSLEHYFNKGVDFLLSYYMKHYPFDDGTIECEKKILISLDDDGEYKLQGFIDRLAYNLETREYEIHDYKTANSMPNSEKIETDRQLALYSIAVKDLFGYDKEVRLIWHYLAHNQKICSKRTNEQLEQLKKETIELIKEIESVDEFPTCPSKLCDWCEYKNICPEFN